MPKDTGQHTRTPAARETSNEVTRIDPLLIRSEYVRLPGDYAYWNGQYADAIEASLKAELRRKTTEARLSIHFRSNLGSEGAKVTEGIIKERVESSEEWTNVKLEEIEAIAKREKLRGTVEALRTKREMLVSLGAHIRQEQEANPFVKSQRTREREHLEGTSSGVDEARWGGSGDDALGVLDDD